MTAEEAGVMVHDILDRMKQVFNDKRVRYGNSWYDADPDFRAVSMYVMINAKENRLRKLAWHDRCQDRAQTAETFADLAMYGIMGVAILMELMTPEEREAFERKLRA